MTERETDSYFVLGLRHFGDLSHFPLAESDLQNFRLGGKVIRSPLRLLGFFAVQRASAARRGAPGAADAHGPRVLGPSGAGSAGRPLPPVSRPSRPIWGRFLAELGVGVFFRPRSGALPGYFFSGFCPLPLKAACKERRCKLKHCECEEGCWMRAQLVALSVPDDWSQQGFSSRIWTLEFFWFVFRVISEGFPRFPAFPSIS